MRSDKNLRVSDAQTVTVTAVSSDSIDLQAQRDLGKGSPLWMHFTVDDAVTAAGAATVTFEVVTADDEDLTVNVEVVGASRVYGKDELTALKRIAVRLNPQLESVGRQFVGGRYVVATGPLTAGDFTADLVAAIGDGRTYYPATNT
jgi:hypothetical protein